ncbi:MAG: polyphosphate polymerase domain-containing protein [Ruminococcaceae bacterium]|nr:polyphosphate polymerase domain-containing protein [Oscillospiraceae bacterium]
MAYQSVFERRELKYLLTRAQQQRVLQAIAPYMARDRYGRTTICNLYFDTADYRLIRHSLEHPVYKEKLRLRSYGRAAPLSEVFVEVKKKFDHTVYKRRIALTEKAALEWLHDGNCPVHDHQISREIAYFLSYYPSLHPTVYLSYEREAYYCRAGGDFRVTFDENVLGRTNELSLETEAWGTPLLAEDHVLMELKCPGAIPLWMTQILTQERLYKTSFSKYGTAYQTLIFPQVKEAIFHV